MSEAKVKVKAEGEEMSATKAKSAKTPKSGDAATKKEAKEEPESPIVKKKHSEAPLKPLKKETEVSSKAAKKEVYEESSKTKKGDSTGKIKVVKKEEVLVSIGKSTSPKGSLKKKKRSEDEPEKKVKKVYNMPGQKHDPPDERDPLRIFYETLYKENPKSEMAEFWMMEHGLLDPDIAKKAFERKKKNQLNQKLGSPVKQSKENRTEKKSPVVVKKSEKKSTAEKSGKKNSNGKSSKTKRIRDSDDDEDDDNDFIMKPKKSKSSA